MSGYSIETLGCRATSADSEAIAALLEQEGGLAPVARQQASVVVVNTCAVTTEAERTARALIRRVRRENPGARILVTGCYAQRAPQELEAMPGVYRVVGNSHKALVAATAVEGLLPGVGTAPGGFSRAVPGHGVSVHRGQVRHDVGAGASGFVPLAALMDEPEQTRTLHRPFAPRLPDADGLGHCDPSVLPLLAGRRQAGRTRPVLRVQDGCGNRCSFCIIPETRGPSRSTPVQEILDAARRFAADGGQELVLSGINLGRWGREWQAARSLAGLVADILTGTALPRLRLSSIEPMDWSEDLLTLFARFSQGEHPRLAAHAHLPLQSGSDTILRRMHRRYRPWHYAEKVQVIHALIPDAAIGADVMVGFPGETEAHFRETYDLVASLPLTYLHLFPFSARPGTKAEALQQESPVHGAAVRERMHALGALAAAKHKAFAERFAGCDLSAVTLTDGTALSSNFLSVRLQSPLPANQMVKLRVLVSADEGGGGLTGQVLPAQAG